MIDEVFNYILKKLLFKLNYINYAPEKFLFDLHYVKYVLTSQNPPPVHDPLASEDSDDDEALKKKRKLREKQSKGEKADELLELSYLVWATVYYSAKNSTRTHFHLDHVYTVF